MSLRQETIPDNNFRLLWDNHKTQRICELYEWVNQLQKESENQRKGAIRNRPEDREGPNRGKNDEESYRALKCKRYRGLEDDRVVKSWRNNYINLSHHDGWCHFQVRLVPGWLLLQVYWSLRSLWAMTRIHWGHKTKMERYLWLLFIAKVLKQPCQLRNSEKHWLIWS